MSDNRLISLEAMRDLPEKAPNVKKLNLGKNKVSNIHVHVGMEVFCEQLHVYENIVFIIIKFPGYQQSFNF